MTEPEDNKLNLQHKTNIYEKKKNQSLFKQVCSSTIVRSVSDLGMYKWGLKIWRGLLKQFLC